MKKKEKMIKASLQNELFGFDWESYFQEEIPKVEFSKKLPISINSAETKMTGEVEITASAKQPKKVNVDETVETLIDADVFTEEEIDEEAKKYPNCHYSHLGFKGPLHAYYRSENVTAGVSTWVTVGGQYVLATMVRPGVHIIDVPGETYVGDVVACIRGFKENKVLIDKGICPRCEGKLIIGLHGKTEAGFNFDCPSCSWSF